MKHAEERIYTREALAQALRSPRALLETSRSLEPRGKASKAERCWHLPSRSSSGWHELRTWVRFPVTIVKELARNNFREDGFIFNL